jgi:hypothetical protein
MEFKFKFLSLLSKVRASCSYIALLSSLLLRASSSVGTTFSYLSLFHGSGNFSSYGYGRRSHVCA